jgi:hypothetical protein
MLKIRQRSEATDFDMIVMGDTCLLESVYAFLTIFVATGNWLKEKLYHAVLLDKDDIGIPTISELLNPKTQNTITSTNQHSITNATKRAIKSMTNVLVS